MFITSYDLNIVSVGLSIESVFDYQSLKPGVESIQVEWVTAWFCGWCLYFK